MKLRTNIRRYALILAVFLLSACAHHAQMPSSLPLPEPAPPSSQQPSDIPSQTQEVPVAEPGETLLTEPPPAAEPLSNSIPIEMTPQVQHWVTRYAQTNRSYFLRTLSHFDQVRPQMEAIFEQHGLPADLVYLCLIESGGTNHAVSRAGATGPWQFMPGTARRYGLTVNRWVDERRDLEKSTTAAACYLAHLYTIFDDWLLACAAYNAGEGTIKRIRRRYPEVQSFWDISTKMPIKRETLAYVPKFLAALAVGTHRERYGMPQPNEHPRGIACDVITVNSFTYLDEIAAVTGRSLKVLQRLNPELIQACTPPTCSAYALKVPAGTGEKAERYLASLTDTPIRYITHSIQPGDTLYDLSRKHNTSVAKIAETNRMPPQAILGLGRMLVIPVDTEKSIHRSKHTYVVAKGDNLKGIALAHGVALQDLIEVNRIRNANMIIPETVLLLPPRRDVEASARPIRYCVKKGDTIWGISRQFSVSTHDVIRWNRLSTAESIFPGDHLTIYQ